VDENIDPAKFGKLRSAFPHLGLGCPAGVGWMGGPLVGVLALLVSGFMHWVSILILQEF